MNYDDVLMELNSIIHKLDSIIDLLFQSTKQFMDTGNVNYELKNIIDKLDMITDSMKDSKEIEMIESVKYDVTYATIDIIDNANIFDKINRLRNAKSILIDFKSKLNMNRPI